MHAEPHRKSHILLGYPLRSTHAMLALATAVTIAICAAQAEAQQGPKCPTCPIVVPGRPMDNKDLNEMRQMNDKKRNFEAANASRKRLLDDEALRLLILARDLKQRTENPGPEPMSKTMEKEAAMIEFLAGDLKQKMTLTVSPE